MIGLGSDKKLCLDILFNKHSSQLVRFWWLHFVSQMALVAPIASFLQWMDISMFVWKQHLHINVVFKRTQFSRTFPFQRKNIPKARTWKEKWSQISYDCLLLSLMWLNEYGVLVSSRSLYDLVFSHWIWSFRLIKSIFWYCIFSLNMKFSTIQYYALR